MHINGYRYRPRAAHSLVGLGVVVACRHAVGQLHGELLMRNGDIPAGVGTMGAKLLKGDGEPKRVCVG